MDDFIEQSVNCYRTTLKPGVLGVRLCMLVKGQWDGRLRWRWHIHLVSEMRNIGLPIMKVMQKRAPTPVFWRSTLEQLGLFDEEFVRNEDDDLNLRIAAQGGVTYVSPVVRYKYWVRGNGHIVPTVPAVWVFGKIKVVRKHRPGPFP
ncbi:MAG: hypothetical protein Ct9H300mP25_16940 [Acidobacteriota bacterium]|nr:MAG: hypothetical protein Ct9H300mP25_16940 [Acidobacteriota bacterium]